MADDKLKAGPESPGEGSVGDAQTVTKPPVPETVEEPAAGTGPVRQPEQSVTPGMGGDVPAQPAPQVEADKVEKSPDQDKKVEPEEKTAKRRGRPPKEQDSPQGDKPEKGPEPRTGRPAKADKAARGKSPSPALDKVSRGKEQELTPAQRGGKTRRERNQNVKDFLAGKRETPFADGKQPPKSTKGAPVKEAEAPAPEIKLPPTPEVPPRPVEQGKIVYLKLSELHPFHTLRDHPFKVQDDKAMDDLVGTIKEHGIMTPATVRPEKDGKGYEIIAGHRRCHGGERAGLDEIPCIVREMTDLEAVREMKNSNKQRGDPLPSELAKLLDLELEAIKRQGARPKNDKEAEALGKLSVEIVGKEHDIILTSKYGKTKCATAKVVAGILTAIFTTALVAAFNFLLALIFYGTEGLDCSILFSPSDYVEGFVPFNITCGTLLKYQILLAFTCTLSVTGITLLISAISKNQIVAFVASMAIFLFPALLPITETNPLFRLVGLLPLYHVQAVSLLSVEQMNNGMLYAVWAIPTALLFLGIGAVISRRVFAKHQVS